MELINNKQRSEAALADLATGGDGVGATYTAVTDEIKAQGSSPTLDGIKQGVALEERDNAINALPHVMQGDYSEDEQRTTYEKAIQEDSEVKAASLPATVSNDYNLDTDPIISSWLNVAEFNVRQQDMFDSWEAGKDTDLHQMINDFGMLFLGAETYSSMEKEYAKTGSYSKALGGVLVGSNIADEQEKLNSMTLAEQEDYTKFLYSLANDAATYGDTRNELIFNSWATMIKERNYSEWDKWIDNSFSVLDAFAIGGGALRAVGKAGKAGKIKVFNQVDALKQQRALGEIRKDSALATVERVNDDTAKAMHSRIVEDQTGEVAKALAGVSREDAIANSKLTQITRPDGSVAYKPRQPEAQVARNKDVSTLTEKNAVHNLTDSEFTSVVDANSKRFNAAYRLPENSGVVSRNEMFSTVVNDSGTVTHRAVFSPAEAKGWTSPELAKQAVLDTFSEVKLTDSEIGLLVEDKTTGLFKPATIEDLTQPNSFMATVERTQSPDIIGVQWDKSGVEKSYRAKAASYAKGYLMPDSSVFDANIFKMSSSAVDHRTRIKGILDKQQAELVTSIKKLPRDQSSKLMDYIHKADQNSLPINPNQMRTEFGLSEDAINTAILNRRNWDEVWSIQNDAKITELKAEGVQTYVNPTTNTQAYGKPIAKEQAIGKQAMIESELSGGESVLSGGKVVDIPDNLTVLKLESPIDVGGKTHDLMLVEKDRVRDLSNTDKVIPYRDGYFMRVYKRPYFIKRVGTDANGQPYTKAISTAKNKKEANAALDRMNSGLKEGSPYKFEVHYDSKGANNTRDNFDVMQAQGNAGFKHKGKLIEDANAVGETVRPDNILDPFEAYNMAVNYVSEVGAMQPYLNASKQRLLANYGEVMPKVNGKPVYPTDINQIHSPNIEHKELVNNAKTVYHHIDHHENGWHSTIDSLTGKAVDSLFEGTSLEGKQLHELTRSPTQSAKTLATQMFIIWNPARQFVMNSTQALLNLGVNPKYASTRLVPDLYAVTSLHLNGGKVGKSTKSALKLSSMSESELSVLYKQFKESGLIDSVSSNSLIKDSLEQLTASRASGLLGKTFTKTNDVVSTGFKSGEYINLASAYLTQYNLARKSKVALNAKDWQDVAAQARNLTLNMTEAAQMKYTKGLAGVFTQYMDVLHKGVELMTTNKVLSPKQKAGVASVTLGAYGTAGTGLGNWTTGLLNELDLNEQERDLAEYGIATATLNATLSQLQNKPTNRAALGLSPLDIGGMRDSLYEAFVDEGAYGLLMNTPAVGAMKRLIEPFQLSLHMLDNPSEYSNTDILNNAGISAASWSSGFGNAFLAYIAFDQDKTYSRSGNQTYQGAAGLGDSIGIALGLQDMDADRYRRYRTILRDDVKEQTKAADDTYNLAKRAALLQNKGQQDLADNEWQAFAIAVNTGNQFPEFKKQLRKRLAMDVREYANPENAANALFRMQGNKTEEQLSKMINAIRPEKRREIDSLIDDMQGGSNE